MFCEVIINSDAVTIDRPFTYKISSDYEDKIEVGQLVRVPFGGGNKTYEAFIINIMENFEEGKYRIKEIKEIVIEEPILTDRDLALIDFLRKNYLCKYIEAMRLLIPKGILKGFHHKKIKKIFINKSLIDKYSGKDIYVDLYNFLFKNNGLYNKADITAKGFSLYALNKLIEEEILIVKEEIQYRYSTSEYESYNIRNLNDEQKEIVDNILNSEEKLFLLKGVTGSGKTEVYMRVVSEILKQEKTSVILVPEISLTPQMIERFKGRFGRAVAVFHSKLSDGERFDEWFRVRRGEVKLIVGARSAIFLPFNNLGLIVIDEEHEGTYKSEQNPKYQTKEVAEFMSYVTECKVILGSATPSVESYTKAIMKDYKLLELKNRALGEEMPEISLVDMREELKSNNRSMFSRQLYEEINKSLERKEQVIIFLNRRGHSSFVSCRNCGFIFKCNHCDISMTYHNNGYLVCHYCGTSKRIEKNCPKCGSKYVKYFGVGTEKVEEETRRVFRGARILRMDVDTTRQKNSHSRIYNAFKNNEADILIGTQMISKGLDFPNVTLVGVIAADMSLNLPDYRSGERSFQLMTQVAGRAGRGEKAGKVIIQTYTPEHYSLQYAKNYDYEGLYKEEIKIRRNLDYPPFSTVLLINMNSKDEGILIKFSKKLGEEMKETLKEYEGLTILGPCPCGISKHKDYYRWQIVVKGKLTSNQCEIIKDKAYEINSGFYKDVRISLDVNPNSLM